MTPQISIVVPVFNEADNLHPLLDEIKKALASVAYEIIFVDDGSTDKSPQILESFSAQNSQITTIFFSRNYGQTAALAAGFKESRGEIIVPLDADGQNDPQDILMLVEKIREGYDVVSGWRKNRKDAFLSRELPSRMANALIAFVTHVPLHDFGCTLKAYRRVDVENLRLYGEMHRFLPAWCAWRGARIVEVEVHHRPRRNGVSHYGIGRTFKVFLDLVSTRFISGYMSKPNYFFGGVAMLLYFLAAVCTVVVFYDKLGPDRWPPLRIPIMLLASFLGIVGTLLVMMGLLAELNVRIYYEVTKQDPYTVRKTLRKS